MPTPKTPSHDRTEHGEEPDAPGLYVVGTPIGNLGDLTPRAQRVLATADVVAAEDTRTVRRLPGMATSRARLVALTEHNVESRAPDLVAAARAGVVALVSEAGTPGVADPGPRLVAAALAAAVPVFAVAGPSALAAALSVSGFDAPDAHFLAFLPRPAGERERRIRAAAASARLLVFFESPRRVAATLRELATWLDDPEVAVCRELTKLHEETVRGGAANLAAHFAGVARGEFTIVVRAPGRTAGADQELVRIYLGEMKRAGARRAGAAAEAAKRFGIARESAYALWEAV